jgi:LytS/YehU family sensor histidine kinase
LQAANNEGIWNEKILSVPVIIATAWWTTAWFYALLGIIVLSFSWWLYKRRIRQVKTREYVRSEFEKKLANVEMSALRAQMNPHFLFNSLNSIDSYIIRNESKKASEYLNNFARLIRLILQNSRSNYISLRDELETLELYLQMETLRFKGKFEYELVVPKDLDTSAIDIPPMLIQPYVENAIWHGLMHQQVPGGGKVKVSIQEKEGMLLCIVEDNGIGRKKAMELKAKKSGIARRSMGMIITQDRMEIINKLYDTQTAVQVTDLEDDKGNAAGTRVVLTIPV